MEISLLASGSKGNAVAVRKNGYTILIDAGLSGRELSRRMSKARIDESSVQSLFISHDHSDHTRGAGVVCRKFNIPLFISKVSFGAVKKIIGKISKVNFFENGESLQFRDLIIKPFSVPHDSEASSCFRIEDKERDVSLVILTDLGFPTKLVKEKIKNASTIVLECNHDHNRLINGSYPWHLKQRIKGKKGHLSNKQAGALLREVMHTGLKNVILAHLSEENNAPELAYESMQEILSEAQSTANLIIADQYEPTAIVEV